MSAVMGGTARVTGFAVAVTVVIMVHVAELIGVPLTVCAVAAFEVNLNLR